LVFALLPVDIVGLERMCCFTVTRAPILPLRT
jgi:hypothetical protein